MLGPLARYLRFLGYDTKSANSLASGNRREDSILLEMARKEKRFLLTRDRELAGRGADIGALHLLSDDVLDQMKQIYKAGLIEDSLCIRMKRCPLCNSVLRRATCDEIKSSDYAPRYKIGKDFCWCPNCRRLYWMGTHAKNLEKRLIDSLKK
ncbi:hypothetical protein F1737_06905 [Methanoplanus sp. FWC-SCC4]|uniref:Mut7-C RNAse domain-containing protein n=2 Tax=Methanochimaera problematica TaxID=2609417 RepID=A0AA97FFF4_9EURY|nr:hypothetical protein F1737_06905 [Methanoplanus sp. FWC-SCC4]